MKLIESFREAVSRAGGSLETPTAINTNNAWGFGGIRGEQFAGRVGGLRFTLRIGTAYFRHFPSEPVRHVRVEGIRKPFLASFFLKLLAEGGVQAVLEYPRKSLTTFKR